jgi:hypothetical protein
MVNNDTLVRQQIKDAIAKGNIGEKAEEIIHQYEESKEISSSDELEDEKNSDSSESVSKSKTSAAKNQNQSILSEVDKRKEYSKSVLLTFNGDQSDGGYSKQSSTFRPQNPSEHTFSGINKRKQSREFRILNSEKLSVSEESEESEEEVWSKSPEEKLTDHQEILQISESRKSSARVFKCPTIMSKPIYHI